MAASQRFEDPPRQSQAVFRAVMNSMARPGRIETVEVLATPAPLPGGMAAIALTLCDFETPVWLDPDLRAAADVVDWFRFETGAPIVETPRQAAFAFALNGSLCPQLDAFAVGTDEYPERSATCVVAVEQLSSAQGLSLTGPGVPGSATLDVGPLRPGFFEERALMRDIFPRGVDLVFVCGAKVVAVPRTTLIEA